MILKVSKLGAKVLRQKCKDVEPKDVAKGKYATFVDWLRDTMHEYEGTGIAAPQVFTSLRIFLYEVVPERRHKKESAVPLTAFFNARYEPVGDEIEVDSEGCLSVPFLWGGEVPRYKKIRVLALNEKGKPVDFEAEGFHARVLQHEIDHLDGLVYLDRMEDLKSLSYTVKLG